MILKEGVYVSDYEMLAESPLGGVEIEMDGFNITEVTDKSLVMVAFQERSLVRLSLQSINLAVLSFQRWSAQQSQRILRSRSGVCKRTKC